jgi:putative FmdB family regulatory protein
MAISGGKTLHSGFGVAGCLRELLLSTRVIHKGFAAGALFALAPLPAMRHFCSPTILPLMPTYEYECLTCGHQFEVVQSMKDPHLTDCPQPGCTGKVRRKIGRGAGIIFKGSGFYQTDYRSDSYKAAAKKDSDSASASPAPKESSSSGSGSGGGSTSPSSPSPAPPAKTSS